MTATGALRKIRQRGWLRRRFSGLTEAEAAAIRADGTPFDLPANAIVTWATTLLRLGLLVPTGAADRWILWQPAVRATGTTRKPQVCRRS